MLSTAVAPSWDAIGKLGAIAVTRTALNFFLSREMQEAEKKEVQESSFSEEKEANKSSFILARALPSARTK